mgnify:FL=1
MKMFSYRARTTDGAKLCGTIAAESAPVAVRTLAAEGKTVLHIREQRTFSLALPLWLRGRIAAEERIAFLHELAALLGAGLPIHEALAHLRAGTDESSAYGQLIVVIHAEVLRGLPLSQAMEMHAEAFPPSLIGMVRAGEESGRLDVILREAAAVLTEALALRESLRGALAYPLFLLAATIFSLLLVTTFILPVFAALLRDLGTELPVPTQLLLTLSDGAAAHPYLLPVTAAGIFLAAVLALRVPSLRLLADGCFLRLPVLGTFLRFAAWQMILRTLAILLHSGIRLDRGVDLVCSVTGNRALAHRLARMEQSLVEGRTFAQVIAHEPYLPALLRGMLAAGEAAGDLERLLQHAADYCRRRADVYAARIEALAEPTAIVLVAFVIFFVVLSVLLPIFDTMDALV